MSAATPAASLPVTRLHVRVRGLVQGVGFRPHVYRLATRLALDGFVRNDGAGVEIEVQGAHRALDAFRDDLVRQAPRLAHIEAVETAACAPQDTTGFRIVDSGGGPAQTMIGHDSAVCADCLAELFDPADRRYRYPFINCTQCGPRYTITRQLPYDRAQTSMAAFAQCPACAREYADPAHRRFHAEPNACPVCGPRLWLADAHGTELPVADVITATSAALARGEIVAIKGLGGFHLAVDAHNAAAVARLRARKQREAKPFAVMVANAASARVLAQVGAQECALLDSPERPIVLLDAREPLAGVAPGLDELGVLLPYTPLHYLLFHEAANRPRGRGWLDAPQGLALVMTSANPNGEPLVRDNEEALRRLHGIADVFLLHDRAIVARCDDSVMRNAGGTPRFLRRARGFAPRAIALAHDGPAVLAFGAGLKNTVAIARGREAFLSPHIGDLDRAATCAALLETVDHLLAILDVRPTAIAHDLHPDLFSTRAALDSAAARGLPAVAVQHHHAHVAAVLAEHRWTGGAVLGLALDGVGYGGDGGAWGGELLEVDGARCTRVGHLRELALPGGDRAAREPWRMAAAALHALGRGAEIERRFPAQRHAGGVAQLLERKLRCPPTSSLGRWFDAAAALLGVCELQAYEAQAAMRLEALARTSTAPTPIALAAGDAPATLDLLPLLDALTTVRDPAQGAALFHTTLIAALDAWVAAHARRRGLRTVALAGGCFLNRVLADGLRARLLQRGLEVLEAREVPPNDGGIALGQIGVARARLGPRIAEEDDTPCASPFRLA